jgi:colanic acid/amylovoran biosynthesis glycosyltransferase
VSTVGRMRICYLLRYAPTQTETFVYREAAGLIQRGHSVRAVSWEAREPGDELPDWTLTHPPGRASLAPLLPRLLGQGARWLGRHQRQKRVLQALWFAHGLSKGEVVHAHFAGESAEWARLAWLEVGAPYILTVHAVDLFKPRPSMPELLRDAREVLTISAFNAESLRQRYGVEARVVRCGVPRAPLADPSLPGVVSVARNVPKKGLDLLTAACARLEQPLELVGASTAVPSSEVAAALRRNGVFALPCRVAADGDRDGIPVALMEAMAAGLPVITTTLPGLDELVDASVGWTVPPDNVDALTQALAEALDQPEQRRKRGLAGRERVRDHWSVEAQVDGVERAWGL